MSQRFLQVCDDLLFVIADFLHTSDVSAVARANQDLRHRLSFSYHGRPSAYMLRCKRFNMSDRSRYLRTRAVDNRRALKLPTSVLCRIFQRMHCLSWVSLIGAPLTARSLTTLCTNARHTLRFLRFEPYNHDMSFQHLLSAVRHCTQLTHVVIHRGILEWDDDTHVDFTVPQLKTLELHDGTRIVVNGRSDAMHADTARRQNYLADCAMNLVTLRLPTPRELSWVKVNALNSLTELSLQGNHGNPAAIFHIDKIAQCSVLRKLDLGHNEICVSHGFISNIVLPHVTDLTIGCTPDYRWMLATNLPNVQTLSLGMYFEHYHWTWPTLAPYIDFPRVHTLNMQFLSTNRPDSSQSVLREMARIPSVLPQLQFVNMTSPCAQLENGLKYTQAAARELLQVRPKLAIDILTAAGRRISC